MKFVAQRIDTALHADTHIDSAMRRTRGPGDLAGHPPDFGGDIVKVLTQRRTISKFPWRDEDLKACWCRTVCIQDRDEPVEATADVAKAVFPRHGAR